MGLRYCVLASVQLCYTICVLFASHAFGEEKAQHIDVRQMEACDQGVCHLDNDVY